MLADTLKEIAGKRLIDMDGGATVLEVLPPATDAQIRALEAALPGPLPDEIRAALRAASRGYERRLRAAVTKVQHDSQLSRLYAG